MRTLPRGIDSVERHTEGNIGLEVFHKGPEVPTAGSMLADAEQPTALRGNECQDANSLLDSRAEGGVEEGSLGVGRVAFWEEVPAIGAEDHGTSAVAVEKALPAGGSGDIAQAAVGQSVSPSNFEQLMSTARSKLSSMGLQRMQNTVEETNVVVDDFFFHCLYPWIHGLDRSWQVRI